MALKQEELALIGEYVQTHLKEWLPVQPYTQNYSIYPVELGERMVRVEEELKNQRELMKQGFDQIDKRLELMQTNMDKRFEQVYKHFDEVNTRIENMQTKMFHFMIWSLGFTITIASIVIAVLKFT